MGGCLGSGVDGWTLLGNVPRAVGDHECRCEGALSLSLCLREVVPLLS